MPYICFSSFYSGRTYHVEIPLLPSPSVALPGSDARPTSTAAAAATAAPSITYGALVAHLKSLWRVQGQPVPPLDLLLHCLDSTAVAASPPLSSRSASTDSAAVAASSSHRVAGAPSTPAASSNSGSLSNASFTFTSQIVAGSDPVLPALLHDSEKANVTNGSGGPAVCAHLFLLCEHAQRDGVERMLIERTTPHPTDLSPAPTATHVERGMAALLSVFTALSAKARVEIEAIFAAIDAARARTDGYAATLKEDVQRAMELCDGDVAREISVSVEGLQRLVTEVKTVLARATAIVSEFSLPAAPTAALLAATAGSSAGGVSGVGGGAPSAAVTGAATEASSASSSSSSALTPEKCYEAAANARRELNAWAKKLAHANELVRSVHDHFFPRFDSLRALPEAYPAAEALAARRVHLYQACARVQNQLAAEAFAVQEQIAAFVQRYGAKFPQNLLRGLDAPVPMLHVAYEPLLRSGSVPVSPTGASDLLKRLGLLPSGATLRSAGASGSCADVSALSRTQPPSPSDERRRQQQHQQEMDEQREQRERAEAAAAAASAAASAAAAAASAAAAAQAQAERQLELSQQARQHELQAARRCALALEDEAAARRAAETEQAEAWFALLLLWARQTRISVVAAAAPAAAPAAVAKSAAPLPGDNDGDDDGDTQPAPVRRPPPLSSRNFVAENNAINVGGAASIAMPSASASTSPNFLRSVDSTTATATSGRAAAVLPSPSDSLSFTARYSRAINYNLSDALAVWAVDESQRPTVCTQLCEILSLAVLNFERPTTRRPPFAGAMGGSLRILWESGDAAPPEMQRGTVGGRVVRVKKLTVLEGSTVPLAEAHCEVTRV